MGNPEEIVSGCAMCSHIKKVLGTAVSFALFPEGGDVGAWMGFVAYEQDRPQARLLNENQSLKQQWV